MALNSGIEELSMEPTKSSASTGDETRQDSAIDPVSLPATKHASVGSKSASRQNPAFAQHDNWIRYKPLMRRLYMDENKTLAEVREYMRVEHEFTASAKMFKTRFIGWGWRKNIKLTAGLDPKEVRDDPQADSVKPGTQVRLANGQIVDANRLQKHLRRKKVYAVVPLATAVRPPDDHHLTEAVFAHTRTYVFGRHEGKISSLTEALSIIMIDEPSTGRWFSFTTAVNDAMRQGNISHALVQMRRAPDEIAAMFHSHPSTLICNIFMLIVQLSSYPEATGPDSVQFRVLLKSLLKYAASLGLSGPLNLPNSHPLPHLMQSLAGVPHSDLSEVAIRAWKVTCQAWTALAFGDSFSAIGSKSLATWLRAGDIGEMDGMWFFKLIEGLIDEKLVACEQLYGMSDFRTLDCLRGKAELFSFIDVAKGKNCYRNWKIRTIYRQILDHGARGSRRTDALRFLAKGYAEK
ncbi:hypothetical protein diail_4618 [Diaporthe ilicicola]|nr:hypothetical protein diail_4618 [Diaporthe ilicicola]